MKETDLKIRVKSKLGTTQQVLLYQEAITLNVKNFKTAAWEHQYLAPGAQMRATLPTEITDGSIKISLDNYNGSQHEHNLIVGDVSDTTNGDITESDWVIRLKKGDILRGNRFILFNKIYDDLIIDSEDYKCFGLVLGTTEIIEPDVL